MKIKQNICIFFLLGLSLTVLFPTSCKKSVNPNYPNFDKNGIKNSIVYYQDEMPSHIQFYVETSGSMNGLYRPKKATKFKYDMCSVLSEFVNADTIKAFTNNSNVINIPIEQFINLMNNGGLNSTKSTDILIMLKHILSDLTDTTKVTDVAVFVSDMKNEPYGATPATLDQYAIEIKKLFKKYPNFSVSIIGFESEYIFPSGNITCKEFPYYMIIIGTSNKVAWTRNSIMNINNINSKGCIDYNVDYACPKYSVIPTSIKGMQRNNFEVKEKQKMCYCLTTYYDIMAECVVSINGRHFPNQITDDSFIILTKWPTTKVSYKVKNNYVPSNVPANRVIIDEINPNIFIELNINALDVYCDVISLSIKNNKQDKEWIKKYYGANNAANLSKTVSIEGFIKGLEDAYQIYNMQNQPMEILISKYNN